MKPRTYRRVELPPTPAVDPALERLVAEPPISAREQRAFRQELGR